MFWYAQYVGDWNDYYGNYRWQKLPGGGVHRALNDCKATYRLIQKMAKMDYSELRPETPYRMFPPVQIWVYWEKIIRFEISYYKNGWRYLNKIFINFPRLYFLIMLEGDAKIRKENFSIKKLFDLSLLKSVKEEKMDDDSIPF